MTIVVLASVFRPYITGVNTMKLNCTAGALAISIPRAPRLPTDLALLESATPHQHFCLALCEQYARRERSAYIATLISDALTGR